MHYKYFILIAGLLLNLAVPVKGQEDIPWREQMKLLIYSSRYFGPNALPIPTLQTADVSHRWEVELRREYHYYTGDHTKDWYGRLYIPLVKGIVGVETTCAIETKYTLTPETRDERFAAGTTNWDNVMGDVTIGLYYQILRSKKWADIVGRMYLRTATGERLAEARFTDAAGYWFDLTFGKTIAQNPSNTASLRVMGMAGFYCWMTNSLVHRQDDAYSYAIGLSGNYKMLTLQTDFSGYSGYENNGDRPMVLRSNLNLEYKKNILSLRFNHGIRDNLYDTYSLGYVRCF